jgi:hypothetical protein
MNFRAGIANQSRSVIAVAWLLTLVASMVALLPTVAIGYVLQGPHVLELMVRAMSGPRTLIVEQQVVIDDRKIADTLLTLNETLSFAFPDRFRSDTWYQDSHRIHVFSAGQSLTVIDGLQVAGPSNHFDRYKDLMLHRSRSALHKMLLTLGVDVEKSSLGRFEDTIVYVLGAQYPEEVASQLWVEREHFLPVRWLLILKSNNHDRLDFIYRDWQKHDQQWYPGRIDTYYNHHLIRQLDIRSVRADAYVPAELFDLSHLTSLYPSTAPETQSQMGQTGTDRADRIIEETLRQYTWE